jgi:heptaprenylglyceryl phosphate synthase
MAWKIMSFSMTVMIINDDLLIKTVLNEDHHKWTIDASCHSSNIYAKMFKKSPLPTIFCGIIINI